MSFALIEPDCDNDTNPVGGSNHDNDNDNDTGIGNRTTQRKRNYDGNNENASNNGRNDVGESNRQHPNRQPPRPPRRELVGRQLPHGSEDQFVMVLKAKNALVAREPLCRFLWAECVRSLPRDHPDRIQSTLHLAAVLQAQGRLREALPLLKEGLAQRERLLSDSHRHTLQSLRNLAALHQSLGKRHQENDDDSNDEGEDNMAQAETLWRRVIPGCEEALGSHHGLTLDALHQLGVVLQDLSKHEEASPLYRQAYQRCQDTKGRDHPSTLTCANNLGLLLLEWSFQEEPEDRDDQDKRKALQNEAERLLRHVLDRYSATLGPGDLRTLIAQHNLASLLYRSSYDDYDDETREDRMAQAEALTRRCVEESLLHLGENNPHTVRFRKQWQEWFGVAEQVINSISVR